MTRGWIGLIALAAIAPGCRTGSPSASEPPTSAASKASASASIASTVSNTDPDTESTLVEAESKTSTDTVDPRPADPVLVSRMVTEEDLPWTSGYGMFPNRAGDDDYNEPPSVADLCPSAAPAPLIAEDSLHYEIDAHDDWVFVDEWVGSAPDAAATFGRATDALDRCFAEQHGVDPTVSIESGGVPKAPGVDEARRYTIRLDAEGEDPVEHELLLGRSGAVVELLTIERSDILEATEHQALVDAALTKLGGGQASDTSTATATASSAGERNDADVMATLDRYGPGNGGLMFTRTKSAIEGDISTLASVDMISTYSIAESGGGVGLSIDTTPATGVDTSVAARDLVVWVAQHAFVPGGALRNDDGVVRPEITLIVGDQSYDSSYQQMVDVADGRLSPEAWLVATAQ